MWESKIIRIPTMKDLGYKGINITGQISKFPIETLYDTL